MMMDVSMIQKFLKGNSRLRGSHSSHSLHYNRCSPCLCSYKHGLLYHTENKGDDADRPRRVANRPTIGRCGYSKNQRILISHIIYPCSSEAFSRQRFSRLRQQLSVVSVYLPNATLMNICQGATTTTQTTWDSLLSTLKLTDNQAKFAIYNDNGYGNTVLESNEKAFLLIRLNSTNAEGMLGEYETIKIEVRTAKGAALTVVRTAPGGLNQDCFVDLG